MQNRTRPEYFKKIPPPAVTGHPLPDSPPSLPHAVATAAGAAPLDPALIALGPPAAMTGALPLRATGAPTLRPTGAVAPAPYRSRRLPRPTGAAASHALPEPPPPSAYRRRTLPAPTARLRTDIEGTATSFSRDSAPIGIATRIGAPLEPEHFLPTAV
jgi:hypothetical protein